MHPPAHSGTLTTDVAVVGGGVAGSSIAAVLAEAGLGVVLVEREGRFRDRVRGEGIHPWGVTELQALGLAAVVRAAGAQVLPYRRFYADRVSGDPSRWDAIEPDLPGEWAISHPALQDALLEHACRGGAQVLRPAHVVRFTRGRDLRLEVTTAEARYDVRARLVIGADGRHSATRRWVGAAAIHDPVHHLVGGCLLDGVALADDTFHLADFEGGTVLVFPLGSGRARTYLIAGEPIAGPLRGTGHRADFVARCGAVFPEGALDRAHPSGPLAFLPNADVWSDRLYDDRVALIGDAAGANDPSGGYGLSLCFRDVREVRDRLLTEPDWDRAMMCYAARRSAYYAVLRAFMQWMAPLTTDVGPEADARRARAARARKADRTLGGFGQLAAHGPDGLEATEAARLHVLGEDLG
ncbi:MAG TPA: NAD(P)/FAD-dependent oxidoreductase [Thermomicrobiaceae bacterium]|nr:NAD(P)/FAD-dependent oxidoreductase [Thermomicrobiaceae bacterium]